MLLRNYDNRAFCSKLPCVSESFGSSENFGDGYISVKDMQGNIKKIYQGGGDRRCPPPMTYFDFWTNNYFAANTSLGERSNMIVCGSGSTPVTYDDFKLESMFTSAQTTYIGGEISGSYNAEADVCTRTVTCKCFAVIDITVNEIGIVTGHNHENSYAYNRVLLLREVLAKPIQVPANSTYTVTLTITVRGLNPNNPDKETTEVATSVEVG